MTKLAKWTLSMGLNDKDTKMQMISTLEAYKVVSNLLASTFGGGSIFEGRGVYTHENGAKVEETTLQINILFAAREDVRAFVETLKKLFNQESIAVEFIEADSDLW